MPAGLFFWLELEGRKAFEVTIRVRKSRLQVSNYSQFLECKQLVPTHLKSPVSCAGLTRQATDKNDSVSRRTMQSSASPIFVTLGPAGTNHEMVTKNYLSFRGLKDASVVLIDDFYEGLEMMSGGHADFMLQVAVHPDCAGVVATAHFKYGIRVIDSFISPSKELGIVTRKEVTQPRTLALQPATAEYTDISGWPEQIHVSSIMRIAEGLLEGQYDSGLTTLEFAERHPERLRVDVRIGTVDDPWLVYGKRRVSSGELVAWPSSPAVEQLWDRGV